MKLMQKNILIQEHSAVVMFGHTHQAVVYKFDADKGTSLKENIIENEFFKLDPSYKWLINTGSVGQPRDGFSSASYFIYDNKNNKMMLRHLIIIMKTLPKIINSGFT